MSFEIFNEMESEVRSYCRKYPAVFQYARNAKLITEDGKEYIDFLATAGSMNYGHNNKFIKDKIMNYLAKDTIINSLDMYTTAKEKFFTTFKEEILKPRGLFYKVMCCGPTGTNAVEAALKLCRKNTGRTNVIAFSGAFHGMSLGSLALTTDRTSRGGAGVSLNNVTFVPYEGDFDSIAYLEWILQDDHSGIEKPAAIILETVQAEGGINVSSIEWLKKIREICDRYDMLLVCDDIQVGNGRTGWFFSFERAGIVPDMVVLSKSISGFGMPMALLLIKEDLDIFKPAEHNGTFRGNQLAFVGGEAAIHYFVENKLDEITRENGKVIEEFLKNEICGLDRRIKVRGIGMIWGIDLNSISSALALKCVHRAFEYGLILEVAGRKDSVLKILPPLTIEHDVLMRGLEVLKQTLKEVLEERKSNC